MRIDFVLVYVMSCVLSPFTNCLGENLELLTYFCLFVCF